MNPCIEWPRGRTKKGYGVKWANGKAVYAHRAAWEEANGPIPYGMQVCHTCDNPPCCNPDHLFLGTNADNQQDSIAKNRHSTYWSSKTHCAWGHEFTPENTLIERRGDRTKRCCRECRRRRQRIK